MVNSVLTSLSKPFPGCFSDIMERVILISILCMYGSTVQAYEYGPSPRPSDQQLTVFADSTPNGTIGLLTLSSGKPVEVRETVGLNDNLIRNLYFLDSITHLDRERIPERVVHGKGSGAFGYFEVTHDVTQVCKAKFLSEIGKTTPVAVRFSSTGGERGTPDTTPDIRGLAIKFYTEEGNFDIVALNTPAFVIKDPVLFPSFVHAIKRNPTSNIRDENSRLDFLTLRPEDRNFMLTLYSDRATPASFREMFAFAIHTYQVENEEGVPSFVRFTYLPDLGNRNMNASEAARLAGEDPDYLTRDLFDNIANGNYPSWTAYLQILSLEDVKNAGFDVFDVTKILPEHQFPLHPYGRFVLNQNPINFFAEVEQLAFSPGNLVPGILGAPDDMFAARIFSYRDAHNYRLGPNVNKIAVNSPMNEVHTYLRDGRSPVNDNEDNAPNYFPNSFHGALPRVDDQRSKLIVVLQNDDGNIEQARDDFLPTFTPEEQESIARNLARFMRPVVDFIRKRVIEIFEIIDPYIAQSIVEQLQEQ